MWTSWRNPGRWTGIRRNQHAHAAQIFGNLQLSMFFESNLRYFQFIYGHCIYTSFYTQMLLFLFLGNEFCLFGIQLTPPDSNLLKLIDTFHSLHMRVGFDQRLCLPYTGPTPFSTSPQWGEVENWVKLFGGFSNQGPVVILVPNQWVHSGCKFKSFVVGFVSKTQRKMSSRRRNDGIVWKIYRSTRFPTPEFQNRYD